MSTFYKTIEKVCEKDPRYKYDAYEFVMQSLYITQRMLNRKGHVSARELLSGIRQSGIERFGSLAKLVFEHWGVRNTEDFGNLVFNLIREKILSKTEEDSIDDFRSVYDFEDAFTDE